MNGCFGLRRLRPGAESLGSFIAEMDWISFVNSLSLVKLHIAFVLFERLSKDMRTVSTCQKE
jgi:hypothetical protein